MLFFGKSCNFPFIPVLAKPPFVMSSIEQANSRQQQIDFKHKSMQAVSNCDQISDNYCLWYSPRSQSDAIHDFCLLRLIKKKPIVVIKQKSDDGTRLPLVLSANRIASFCIQNEKMATKRHFYEVGIQQLRIFFVFYFYKRIFMFFFSISTTNRIASNNRHQMFFPSRY